MKLFKNYNRNTNHAVSDKAAGWIAGGILKTQKRFADTLGAISARWKTKQQWVFLCMLCLVFGGLSVVALVKAFNNKTQSISKPAAIEKPRSILKRESKNEVLITDNEIGEVHSFKRLLDSLSKTAEGKIKVKRLLSRRPGLMDSIEMVEQLYYSQKK